MSVTSPIAKMLFQPLTLNLSSTLILRWPSKSFFNKVSLSHAEASGFPIHKKWQSASMVPPFEVWYIFYPSVNAFKSTDCSSLTTTFFDFNQFRVLSSAFAPTNSRSLAPLCTSVSLAPASSTPVGPPPIIRMDWSNFIFNDVFFWIEYVFSACKYNWNWF